MMAVLAQVLAQAEAWNWTSLWPYILQTLIFLASLLSVWLRMRVENQGERRALRVEMQSQFLAISKQQNDELQTLREEFRSVATRNEQLEEAVSSQAMQIQRGRDEADRLIERNASLRNDIYEQHKEFEAELDTMRVLHEEQMTALTSQMDQQSQRIGTLREQMAEMKRLRSIDKRKIKTLRMMVDNQNAQVETLLSVNRELRAALRDASLQANTLRDERDNLKSQLVRLEAKLQSTQDELERLRELVNILNERGQHDDEVDAVRIDGDGGGAAGDGDAGGDGDGAGRRADERDGS